MRENLKDEFAIARDLQAGGNTLGNPADDRSLQQLESIIGSKLGETALALYSTFNGFDARLPDDRSMICLWSLEATCLEIETNGLDPKGQIIADHFLDADYLLCDLSNDNSEVLWKDRSSVAAKNLLIFCQSIADGTFED